MSLFRAVTIYRSRTDWDFEEDRQVLVGGSLLKMVLAFLLR
jgi:hypothetical protein